MHNESPIATITSMTASTAGVLSGSDAVRRGVTRKQLLGLCRNGFLERVLPDTYRVAAVATSGEQQLRAALMWAGPAAAAWCLSAGMMYRLEEVVARPRRSSCPGTSPAGLPPTSTSGAATTARR